MENKVIDNVEYYTIGLKRVSLKYLLFVLKRENIKTYKTIDAIYHFKYDAYSFSINNVDYKITNNPGNKWSNSLGEKGWGVVNLISNVVKSIKGHQEDSKNKELTFTTGINAAIPFETKKKLVELSEKLEMSLSNTVRYALQNFLKQLSQKQKTKNNKK